MTGRLEMTGRASSRGDASVAKGALHDWYKAPAKHRTISRGGNKVPIRLLMPTRTQYATWGTDVALAGAGGAMVHHSRRPVAKRSGDPRGQRSGLRTAGGAAAGLGATDLGLNVGGWVTREGIKNYERRVDAGEISHPTTRKQRRHTLSMHRKTFGITTGSPENAPQAYYRSYPKGLPAWKTKRFMGYKNHPGVVGGALAAGTLAGAALGARRQQPVTKVANRKGKDYSGVATGSGTMLSGVGLLGGGVPGARPNSGRLGQVRTGGKTASTGHLVSAARGGIFGYREDAHHSYLNRQNVDEAAHGGKKTTRVNYYLRGQGTGKIPPEKKVIEHMRAGRVMSNYALVGGAGLLAEGLRQRRKNLAVAKRARGGDYRSDALIAGGATTALGGGGISLALRSQGRKWANRSAASLDAARAINPKLGGYTKKPSRFGVPDVAPHRSTALNVAENKKVFAGRSSKATEAAGRLKGAASQERYFAGVYGNMSRYARKAGTTGALVGAAGLGAKYLQVKPQKVGKIWTPKLSMKPVRESERHYRDATRAAELWDKPVTTGSMTSTSHKATKGNVEWQQRNARYYAVTHRTRAAGHLADARTGRARVVRDRTVVGAGATTGLGTTGALTDHHRRGVAKVARLKVIDDLPAAAYETAVKPSVRRAPTSSLFGRSRGYGSTLGGMGLGNAVSAGGRVSRQTLGGRLRQTAARQKTLEGVTVTQAKELHRQAGFTNSAGRPRKWTIADSDNIRAQKDPLGYGGMSGLARSTVWRSSRRVSKVDTTMSDAEAHRIAARYDTKGPLPKHLDRDARMKAYEGRYIASGGRKAESWHRRANAAEVGRNVGLAGATASAATLLARRGKRLGPVMGRTPGIKHLTERRLETGALASGLGGGWSELYGEHARSRRASYQNSPGGVAASALSRMKAYTPTPKKTS